MQYAKTIIFYIVVITVLSDAMLNAQTREGNPLERRRSSARELLRDAQMRFDEISKRRWNWRNLALYNDVAHRCERLLKEHKKTDPDSCLQAAKLILTCKEKQARYAEMLDAIADLAEITEMVKGKAAAVKEIEKFAEKYLTFGGLECVKAIQIYQLLIQKYPEPEYADKARFQIAEGFAELGSRSEQLEQYRELVEKGGQTSWSEKVHKRIADVYYTDGNYDEAAAVLEKLIEKFPESKYLEEAIYRLGFCRLKQKDLSGAKDAFENALQRFPESRYVQVTKLILRDVWKELERRKAKKKGQRNGER